MPFPKPTKIPLQQSHVRVDVLSFSLVSVARLAFTRTWIMAPAQVGVRMTSLYPQLTPPLTYPEKDGCFIMLIVNSNLSIMVPMATKLAADHAITGLIYNNKGCLRV